MVPRVRICGAPTSQQAWASGNARCRQSGEATTSLCVVSAPSEMIPSVKADAAETGDGGDVDQSRRRSDAARELDDDVRATGDDARALAVARQQGQRVVQRLWLKVLLPHCNAPRLAVSGACRSPTCR